MSSTNFEFLDALGQIARDKGISVDTLLDALANALVAAYKRLPDSAEEAVVTIDPDNGEIKVYGQELDLEGNVIREWDDTPEDFGRIAAQTAKQVIMQRIREVERDMKYDEYAGREGDIVTGIVQQTDNRYTLLDLVTYFTVGPKEARAWTIHRGTKGPQAAGVIHTDFEKGFNRAETIAYDDVVACGGEVGAKEAGKMRLEGKEYVVKDGDVMHFRFAN